MRRKLLIKPSIMLRRNCQLLFSSDEPLTCLHFPSAFLLPLLPLHNESEGCNLTADDEAQTDGQKHSQYKKRGSTPVAPKKNKKNLYWDIKRRCFDSTAAFVTVSVFSDRQLRSWTNTLAHTYVIKPTKHVLIDEQRSSYWLNVSKKCLPFSLQKVLTKKG